MDKHTHWRVITAAHNVIPKYELIILNIAY